MNVIARSLFRQKMRLVRMSSYKIWLFQLPGTLLEKENSWTQTVQEAHEISLCFVVCLTKQIIRDLCTSGSKP